MIPAERGSPRHPPTAPGRISRTATEDTTSATDDGDFRTPGIARRIDEYQAAMRALQSGGEGSALAPHAAEVGRLGTELMRFAEGMERRFQELSMLLEISNEIAAGLFLDDVLERVYESFHSVIPYDRIGCALLSDDRRTLTAHWARSKAEKLVVGRGYSAPIAGSSLEQVLATGQPRILNDLAVYLADHPESASTRAIIEEGMRSSLTCPLSAQGKPVGFLFFSSMQPNAYRDAHPEIFRRVAGQLSVLIEKSRLYQRLYELNGELVSAQRALVEQATRDALTGLLNRPAILKELEVELSRARRHETPVCVLLADVDHFKLVNDEHGHLAGDEVLRAVARRLQSTLRGYDRIGRYGGEEFLVVLGGDGNESAMRAAERLRLAVGAEPVAAGSARLTITASIGAAIGDRVDVLRPEQLIAAADEALYAAKRGGRNRVEVRTA